MAINSRKLYRKKRSKSETTYDDSSDKRMLAAIKNVLKKFAKRRQEQVDGTKLLEKGIDELLLHELMICYETTKSMIEENDSYAGENSAIETKRRSIADNYRKCEPLLAKAILDQASVVQNLDNTEKKGR